MKKMKEIAARKLEVSSGSNSSAFNESEDSVPDLITGVNKD